MTAEPSSKTNELWDNLAHGVPHETGGVEQVCAGKGA